MDRAVSDLLIVVSAVAIVSVTALAMYVISLRAKRQARELGDESVHVLENELDAVRAELGAQVAELQERVDFAERMLAQREATPERIERGPPPA